jgi:hypothetical protein
MTWIDWGMVGGIILSAGVLLLSILLLYPARKGSTPRGKRVGIAPAPEPLIHPRVA